MVQQERNNKKEQKGSCAEHMEFTQGPDVRLVLVRGRNIDGFKFGTIGIESLFFDWMTRNLIST